MPGIGTLIGAVCGLIESVWLAGGLSGWRGFGRAEILIMLLYACAGAVVAQIHSLAWRRLPSPWPREDRTLEAATLLVLFAGSVVLARVNRLIPDAALSRRSLWIDVMLLAAMATPLALFAFIRGRRRHRLVSWRYPAVWATSVTVLILLAAGANAWLEAREPSPLGPITVLKDRHGDWTFPPAWPARAPESVTPASAPSHPPSLILIGLDGASWKILLPLVKEGRLPHIASLMKNGIAGELRSEPDAFSPIVWTTLMTGKEPSRHGLDSTENSTSSHRKVGALWEMLSRKNESLLVVNVPGTYPADEIHGAMLSGFPNDGETGNNLGYVATTRPMEAWDPASGLRWIPMTEESSGEGAAYSFSIRESAALPRLPVLITLATQGAWAIDAMRPWLTRTYANLSFRRTPEGLAFDLAECAGCSFTLRDDWSPWVILRRDGHRVGFRIRRIESSDQATSLYVTPLFLLDTQRSITPSELSRDMDAANETYLVEGSGWLHFREPRLLGPLAEHLFGVANDRFTHLIELWEKRPWDGLVYVITLTDRVQHGFWSFLEPGRFPGLTPPNPYPAAIPAGTDTAPFARAIPDAYEWADEAIARLLEKASPETLVVLVSDHGCGSESPIHGAGGHDPDGVYVFSGAGLVSRGGSGSAPILEGPTLRLVDIVPTVLPLLGYPVAKDFDGHPAEFVTRKLEESGHALAWIPTYETGLARAGDPHSIGRAEMDQIRSLGYVQ